MKKYLLLMFLSLIPLYTGSASAFSERETHPDLTKMAILASDLQIYLVNYLGNSSGMESIIPGLDRSGSTQKYNILKWLQEGSTDEDKLNFCRASNHFHNPLFKSTDPNKTDWQVSQMSDSVLVDGVCGTSNRYSDVTWATGYTSSDPSQNTIIRNGQTYGWDNARQYFYDALISTELYSNYGAVPYYSKENQFALAFRSLGMVMHLLQDMAVPAHARNDMTSHLSVDRGILNFGKNAFEKYVSKKSQIFRNISTVKPVFVPPTKLTNFWDTNIYNGTAPEFTRYAGIGLAEYTNANFLSDFTIFNQNPTAEHYFPYPSEGSVSIGTRYIANPFVPGTTVAREYFVKTSDGDAGYLLAGVDYLTVVTAPNPPYVEIIPPLDNYVHAAYAERLLPRAIGYSAVLLDYFFRGKLEISPPAQQVYGIIDGSILPQRFTTIKAKVKNATSNEAITAGTLVAVARYKTDSNYLPDLVNNPTNNSSAAYSYSVSTPVAISQAMNTTPTEFTFDFSSSPIPAGITDLTLQVVFKGTLGNETDNAVAVGMKDLSEPTHQVIWNHTDMFSLDYNLYTAQQIRDNPTLAALAGDAHIDPYDISFTIGYSGTPSSPTFSPEVAAAVLPKGRHMRLIGIFDNETANYMEMQWSGLDSDSFKVEQIHPAKKQTYGTTWLSSPAATPFRNWLDSDGVTKRPFMQHYNTGVLRCKPISYDGSGNSFCTYPVEQANSAVKTPITATIY